LSRSRRAPSRDMERALRGVQKGAYVARMFDRIARRYDLMNRLMSLGQDQRWRRRMATLAQVPDGGLALDLATGTGDVAHAVLQRTPSARVIGADFSLPMMRVGQNKSGNDVSLRFAGADALALPFRAGQFDAILHAFLMRNIEDIPAGFREQWRVLKAGGTLVCLEIVGPSSPLVGGVYRLFFQRLVPHLGALVSGDPDAYTYLPTSVLRFPPPAELSRLIEASGFVQVRYERVMLGAIAIHTARKPIDPD
jgi:demethylmenaquinone methyltransferase / 2-methoxy-6-polyprenyl-1,4-benzoquinol methylase